MCHSVARTGRRETGSGKPFTFAPCAPGSPPGFLIGARNPEFDNKINTEMNPELMNEFRNYFLPAITIP